MLTTCFDAPIWLEKVVVKRKEEKNLKTRWLSWKAVQETCQTPDAWHMMCKLKFGSDLILFLNILFSIEKWLIIKMVNEISTAIIYQLHFLFFEGILLNE